MFYLKMFMINIVLILFVAMQNRYIFNNFIEEHEILHLICGIWATLTFLSVPSVLIYLIVKIN